MSSHWYPLTILSDTHASSSRPFFLILERPLWNGVSYYIWERLLLSGPLKRRAEIRNGGGKERPEKSKKRRRS